MSTRQKFYRITEGERLAAMLNNTATEADANLVCRAVNAWMERLPPLFEHTEDEPKERQGGENYLRWLQRTLSFARTYGAPVPGTEGRDWMCGYCALERHADCIVDCGCPDPRCQPHSSGTTGSGMGGLDT